MEGTKGFLVGQDQSLSYFLKACSEICVENGLRKTSYCRHPGIQACCSGGWARVGAFGEVDGLKRAQEVNLPCLSDLRTVVSGRWGKEVPRLRERARVELLTKMGG